MRSACVCAAPPWGSAPDVQDILTEFNTPEGDCPICLLPLADAPSAAEPVSAAAYQTVKLPCYHCLHRCDFHVPITLEPVLHPSSLVTSA